MGAEVEALVRTQQPVAHAAVLYTVGLDGVRTPCLRWQGPFGDTAELVEQIEERALRQANALGGVHAFMLELAGADGAVLGTEFFRVSAESFRDGSIVSEPANEGGVLAQMMRHTEALMKTHVQGGQINLQAAQKMIETSSRRAEFAEAKFLDMLTTVHSILTGERQAQVDLVKAEARAAATKQIGGKIAMLIPEISAAFLSGTAGPKGAAHAAVLRAKNLFSTITPDQLKGILGLLEVEQQGAMLALLAGLAKEHEAEQKALKAAETATAEKTTNGAKH